MKRQDWAIARWAVKRAKPDCRKRGHIVVPIGPYLICRDLSCKTLVVDVAS